MSRELKRFTEYAREVRDFEELKDICEYSLKSPSEQLFLALNQYEEYKKYADKNKLKYSKKFSPRPYQKKSVDIYKKTSDNLISIEIPPGGGKTFVASMIAFEEIKKTKQKIIYISPSITAINEQVEKFRIFFADKIIKNRKIVIPIEYSPDNIGIENDILFFTPYKLVKIYHHNKELFDYLMKETGCMIVDEAHHFPIDEERIYGKIAYIANEDFIKRNKSVLVLTATYGRMDGEKPFGVGRENLAHKITIQKLINDGFTPPIYGMTILLKLECKTSCGKDLLMLKFSKKEELKYLNDIATCIHDVFIRIPRPTCVFVQSIAHAYKLQKIVNNKLGKGKRFEVLVGDVNKSDREIIIENIKSGKSIGYITCCVGSESIDIPEFEVVHMVRRTRSINFLIQSIGRCLRLYKDKDYTKKWAVVIDYGIMKKDVILGSLGLASFGIYSESIIDKNDVMISGPLVVPEKMKYKIEKDGFFYKGHIKENTFKEWITKSNAEIEEIIDDKIYEKWVNKFMKKYNCSKEMAMIALLFVKEDDPDITPRSYKRIQSVKRMKKRFTEVDKVLTDQFNKFMEEHNVAGIERAKF